MSRRNVEASFIIDDIFSKCRVEGNEIIVCVAGEEPDSTEIDKKIRLIKWRIKRTGAKSLYVSTPDYAIYVEKIKKTKIPFFKQTQDKIERKMALLARRVADKFVKGE